MEFFKAKAAELTTAATAFAAVANERMQTSLQGKKLLDEGGANTEKAILAKQALADAAAADAAAMKEIEELVSLLEESSKKLREAKTLKKIEERALSLEESAKKLREVKTLFQYTYEQCQQKGLLERLEEERLAQNISEQDWETMLVVEDKNGTAVDTRSTILQESLFREFCPVTVLLKGLAPVETVTNVAGMDKFYEQAGESDKRAKVYKRLLEELKSPLTAPEMPQPEQDAFVMVQTKQKIQEGTEKGLANLKVGAEMGLANLKEGTETGLVNLKVDEHLKKIQEDTEKGLANFKEAWATSTGPSSKGDGKGGYGSNAREIRLSCSSSTCALPLADDSLKNPPEAADTKASA